MMTKNVYVPAAGPGQIVLTEIYSFFFREFHLLVDCSILSSEVCVCNGETYTMYIVKSIKWYEKDMYAFICEA